jgi:hypothetical protein
MLTRGTLVSICLAAIAAIAAHALFNMTFIRAEVMNAYDLQAFRARELPGFIHQREDSLPLQDLRKRIAPLIRPPMSELDKVVVVRKWVRDQQSDKPGDWQPPYVDDTENPQRLLEEQRQGFHGACRRFSYILSGALLSIGLDARIVHAATDFRRFGRNHTLVEVWIDALHKWVLVDPTFDTLIFVDGSPASSVEIYLAAKHMELHRISFRRDGSRHLPAPTWEGYGEVFKHLYVARTNGIFDGYGVGLFRPRRISFLHLVDDQAEPYPQRRKELLMFVCASSALILLFRFGTLLFRPLVTHEEASRDAREDQNG